MLRGRLVEQQAVTSTARAPYVPGLMALRLGQVMEEAVRVLRGVPDILLLDATTPVIIREGRGWRLP